MKIEDYINEQNIYFLKKKDKHGILEELIEKAIILNKIENGEEFKRAIEVRESMLSTGIGVGVAVPHAKISEYGNFFVVTGKIESPVEWDSIDQKPVSLVFLIGAPKNQHAQYLKLLAQIMVSVKNPDRRNKLMNAGTVKEIAEVLKDSL